MVKVKVGPITAQYKGTATFVEQDAVAGNVRCSRREGRDTRGQGNANATITAMLQPDGEGHQGHVVTDLTITGKVAQFGRGVLADVSSKLIGQFVANLESTVLTSEAADDAPAAPKPARAARKAPAKKAAAATAKPAAATTPAAEVDDAELARLGTQAAASEGAADRRGRRARRTLAADRPPQDRLRPGRARRPRRRGRRLDASPDGAIHDGGRHLAHRPDRRLLPAAASPGVMFEATDAATDADRATVERLLGRPPRGAFAVAVRDRAGEPVVIVNAPLLDDGTPMPTRYWLVGPTGAGGRPARVGRRGARGRGGVDPTGSPRPTIATSASRDLVLPPGTAGPRPSGGVGGTRQGVKCLHAHLAWYLAGGRGPGRPLDRGAPRASAATTTSGRRPSGQDPSPPRPRPAVAPSPPSTVGPTRRACWWPMPTGEPSPG